MLSQMSSDDEARVEGSGDPPPNKKQKKEKREDRNRGNRMSVQARIAQFPKEFFQMGEEMWCKSCQICVDYKQMCTAKNHLSSKTHAAAIGLYCNGDVEKRFTLGMSTFHFSYFFHSL